MSKEIEIEMETVEVVETKQGFFKKAGDFVKTNVKPIVAGAAGIALGAAAVIGVSLLTKYSGAEVVTNLMETAADISEAATDTEV